MPFRVQEATSSSLIGEFWEGVGPEIKIWDPAVYRWDLKSWDCVRSPRTILWLEKPRPRKNFNMLGFHFHLKILFISLVIISSLAHGLL